MDGWKNIQIGARVQANGQETVQSRERVQTEGQETIQREASVLVDGQEIIHPWREKMSTWSPFASIGREVMSPQGRPRWQVNQMRNWR